MGLTQMEIGVGDRVQVNLGKATETTWVYIPFNGQPLGIRKDPRVDAEQRGQQLENGEVFKVSEELEDESSGITFLKLADGRGWAFDRKPGGGDLCERHEVDGKKQVVRAAEKKLASEQQKWFNNGNIEKALEELSIAMVEEELSIAKKQQAPDKHTTSAPAAPTHSANAVDAGIQEDSRGSEYFFLSLRFTEPWLVDFARKLKVALEAKGHTCFLCDADAGDDFGEQVIVALLTSTKMVSLVSDNPAYGELGTCVYTTYHELKYYSEREKTIIPVRMYELGPWPPVAKLLKAGETKSAALVDKVFGPSLCYINGWAQDAEFVADQIAKK